MKTKKTLIIILSIVSLILLSITVVLSCILLVNRKKLIDNKTDIEKYYDIKCAAFSAQNFNASKGQIVFIGDSITDLYILDDHYSKLDLATYNRGIGGDTTSGVLKRLQVSLFDIKPSKVVLLIGTNDINSNVYDGAINRYEQIIDNIYKELPEVELYCVSVIPQNDDIEAFSGERIQENNNKVVELNEGIKKLTAKYGATYIDLFSQISDENNCLIKDYSDDGLHLNVKGLSVWTELMMPYFSSNNE